MEAVAGTPRGVLVGLALIFAGFVVLFLSLLAEALRSGGKGDFGAVVVIGPIPIVVGNNPTLVKVAVIGAIVLMILALILFLAPGVLARRGPTP